MREARNGVYGSAVRVTARRPPARRPVVCVVTNCEIFNALGTRVGRKKRREIWRRQPRPGREGGREAALDEDESPSFPHPLHALRSADLQRSPSVLCSCTRLFVGPSAQPAQHCTHLSLSLSLSLFCLSFVYSAAFQVSNLKKIISSSPLLSPPPSMSPSFAHVEL